MALDYLDYIRKVLARRRAGDDHLKRVHVAGPPTHHVDYGSTPAGISSSDGSGPAPDPAVAVPEPDAAVPAPHSVKVPKSGSVQVRLPGKTAYGIRNVGNVDIVLGNLSESGVFVIKLTLRPGETLEHYTPEPGTAIGAALAVQPAPYNSHGRLTFWEGPDL